MRLLFIASLLAAAVPNPARAQQPPAAAEAARPPQQPAGGATPPAQPLPGNDWVGKRVVTKYGATLNDPRSGRIDDEGRARSLDMTGHARGEFRIYKVEAVNGPWLWLDDEDGASEGWVESSWVIPLARADEFYTGQIRANPNVALNYVRRAMIRDEQREYDAAIADYDEALRLEPRDESSFCNRGNVWKTIKEYDKAITDYNEAIKINPKLPLAYNNRGGAWYAKRDIDKAIADYDEAIKLDPKFTWAYVNRGCCRRAKGNYDGAIADYNEAIKLDPFDPSAYNNRGGAWLYKRDYDKAIADYTQAIKLNPAFAWAYDNRADAELSKREYDKAIADYSEAIRIDPKDPQACTGRAWVLATCPDAKLRDGKGAVEDATRACELTGWKDASALGTLAAAQAERGDFDRAVEFEEKALAITRNEAELKSGRERLALYKEKKPYHVPPAPEAAAAPKPG